MYEVLLQKAHILQMFINILTMHSRNSFKYYVTEYVSMKAFLISLWTITGYEISKFTDIQIKTWSELWSLFRRWGVNMVSSKVELLRKLFNTIIKTKKMTITWRTSIMVSIYKLMHQFDSDWNFPSSLRRPFIHPNDWSKDLLRRSKSELYVNFIHLD